MLMLVFRSEAQNLPHSIHFEQNNHYKQYGSKPAAFYDSLDGFAGRLKTRMDRECQLQRIVFGFHPYWAGSDYLNYQWNLISDLCYFSYEVDPSTGDPVTVHEWLTDPAIDSAKSHGVRVHLCATIFSGHTAFFTSPPARQNLVNQLISLVLERSADGINMDIELLPSSLSDSVTVFMRELSVQLRAALPDAILSIDLPAVDWDHDYNIEELEGSVDWFFIMGYDYYWNGSSHAGPVSPLYSLTQGYDYSLSRTISAYQHSGLENNKFILGIPYYGRQWKTQSDAIPSPIAANGTALAYSVIRNNSSIYNESSYAWEPNSFSSCYIFFQNNSWNQCFIGLDHDLRKKYDIVNYRDLAGIGIWALGYDDGHAELWQAISDKFTGCYVPAVYDTVFDSGGPAWNYYVDEDYIMVIDQGFHDLRYLTFSDINLEQGYDYLWLYAGPDTTSPFLGGFSGHVNPGTFTSPDGAFTLRFFSDGLQNAAGWKAVYHDGSLGAEEIPSGNDENLHVYPNPAVGFLTIDLPADRIFHKICIYDHQGRLMVNKEIHPAQAPLKFQLNVSGLQAGVYYLVLKEDEGRQCFTRFVRK